MTLREAACPPVKGERLAKIASSFRYVAADCPVHELLAELQEPYQNAIAVVSEDLAVEGIIIPRDLVETLGKPFGRDLLKRQLASDIMVGATTFRYDEYISEATERIKGDIERDANAHYLLVDERSRFCGHFSAQDILHDALNEHRRELETATAIQGRLVPPCLALRGARTSITCSSVMAQGVGGDFYFAREYEKGHWFFCLCDISGKGIAAAIITALLSGVMARADFSEPLEDFVARLNDIVLESFNLEKYLTGFFVRFHEATGELEYADMGHAWFFSIDDGRIERIQEEADNLPVGLVAGVDVIVKTLRLAPGTVLALMSDGIVEQENRDRESYPIEELGRCVGRAVRNGDDLVRAKVRILESFFAFKKDVPQHDDISLLLFHYER
jgi:sigma-B regulation protein RsbU (phosphoserine phosphatase)